MIYCWTGSRLVFFIRTVLDHMYPRNVILTVLIVALGAFAQGPSSVFNTIPHTADGPYQVKYAANLPAGESYIDITNTGANGAGAQTGNICANVYAIDPNEDVVACCSCLITPDATVHLGAKADLVSNTANGRATTSITIKLLASLGTGSVSPTSCSNSAAEVGNTLGQPNLPIAPFGMLAWGTTIHSAPGSAVSYAETESPFLAAVLSATEAESLADRCAFIIGNLGGAGICNSCLLGALNGAKM